MTLTSDLEINGSGERPFPPAAIEAGPVASALPSGPRLPRREVWLELPDEYAGFRIKVWVNYPRRLNDDLRSGETPRIARALSLIVVEHNDWRDDDGAPFPPAGDPAFWDDVPDELAAAVIVLLMVQVGKLAVSLQAKSGR